MTGSKFNFRPCYHLYLNRPSFINIEQNNKSTDSRFTKI